MIKILAIGNSFSQNATQWLELLGGDLLVRNLYIGGCSLERHCLNAREDKSEYDFEESGAKCRPERISIKEALALERWDFVTVQQCSGYSGKIETYYPYLPELIGYVKRFSDAEIVFHQTWAYETGAAHPDFAFYDHDRKKMHEKILEVSRSVAEKEGLRLIRTGEAVEQLRRTQTFDPERGGLAITCDGFHLSVNYGRFLAACVWLKFFTGKLPAYLQKEDLSEPYRAIREVIGAL